MIIRSERGFTLPEVLLAVIISSILFAVMAQATIIGFKTIDNTNDRLAGSNDTQLVASYFTGDVDSADTISTTGERAHAAPSVSVTSANSKLVSFWTLRTATEVTPPTGMVEQWERTSAGPVTANRLTIAMADDTAIETGDSGNRISQSATGTSSVGHTVALARQGPLAPVTLRAVSPAPGNTAGATSLTLAKPTGTATGDALLAHIALASGTAAVTAPAGWTLLNSRTAPTAKSLLYQRTASSSEPVNWTWTFGTSVESVGAVAAYYNVSAFGAHGNEVNPCGGDTPALLLAWTDFGTSVVHEVTYNVVTQGDEIQIVRRHCEGTTGNPASEQTLARSLVSAAPADVFAQCQPAACGPLSDGVSVVLTLTERPPKGESLPRRYQMRAATRTTR